MAPKKAAPPPPVDTYTGPRWVPPADGSEQWFQSEGGTTRHIRAGAADIARGSTLIKEGHWRIEYRINRAQHNMRGFGIVLGVTDAEAPAWADTPPAPGQRKAGKPFVAWGICPSSGRLIRAPDPKMGRFGGATLGDVMVVRKAGEPVAGMTITVDVEMQQHHTTEDAAVARREYSGALHPLDVRREFPLHLKSLTMRNVHQLTGMPVAKPSSLTISVNGGKPVDADVRLPEAGVYPWMLLTGEGDEVTLMSVKRLDDH
jgi:hypothetical protein